MSITSWFSNTELKGLTTKQRQMLQAKAIETVAKASKEFIANVMTDTTGAKNKKMMRRKLDPMRSRLKASKK